MLIVVIVGEEVLTKVCVEIVVMVVIDLEIGVVKLVLVVIVVVEVMAARQHYQVTKSW